MRASWFPGGAGCPEENHGLRWFLGVPELSKSRGSFQSKGSFQGPFLPQSSRGTTERQSHVGKLTRNQGSGFPNKCEIEFEDWWPKGAEL